MTEGFSIVERKLEAGKWRIRITETYGHDITALFIKGLRDRPWPLTQVTFEEFRKRFPFDETNDNPPAFIRGTPSLWTVYQGMILLWPAPVNDGWTLQVHMTEKQAEQRAAARNRALKPTHGGAH
jgi:hypothetical protein